MADDLKDAEVIELQAARRRARDIDTSSLRPMRRWRLPLVIVLLAIATSPFFDRLLGSYRGIVLEIKDGKMLVQPYNLPPEWHQAIDVASGTMVEKPRLAWTARPTQATAEEQRLFELYRRYTSAYDGTIVELRPPLSPNGATVAVVEVEGGERILVPLWAQELSTAAVGRRLRKLPNRWEPELLPQARD